MNGANVVGKPILEEGATYKVDPSGQPQKNEFANAAGYFRVVNSEDEMKEAGLTAAKRVSTVFPCEFRQGERPSAADK